MAERYRKNWRELCNCAIATSDTDELLRIIHELNLELAREEKTRQDVLQNRLSGTPQGQVSSLLGNRG